MMTTGNLPASPLNDTPASARLPFAWTPLCEEQDLPSVTLEEVRITAEFHERPAREFSRSVELGAFTHLSQFLTEEPSLLLNQLAETLLSACGADSAGVLEKDPDSAFGDVRWVSLAGQIARLPHRTIPHRDPSKTVLESGRAEVFHRPERFFQGLFCDLLCEEYLAVPWQLSSGQCGTVVVISHTPGKRFDPQDLRLVTMLSRFAALGMDRRNADQRKREEAATVVSAARLADHLAHVLNNPLQALINSLYLVDTTAGGMYLLQSREQALRLSRVVQSVIEMRQQNDPIVGSMLEKIGGHSMSASGAEGSCLEFVKPAKTREYKSSATAE